MSVVEVPQPQPDKIVSYPQLVAKIREEAGLDESEMENLRRVGQLAGWQVEGQCPPLPAHVIFAMFIGDEGDRTDSDHMPGDVRVYVRPKTMIQPDGELSPFFRCVINRAPNTALRIDAMPIEAWVEDVAAEFLASIIDDEEEEETEPQTCKASVPTSGGARVACGAALESDARFCHRCATPVRKCGNCGHFAELPDRFCAGCGVPLVAPPVAG